MKKVWIGPLGLILLGPLLFLATNTAGDTLSVAPTGPDLTSTNATIEVVVPGANFPVALAFAPDGRLFYTEHCTGNVRIVAADDQLMAQPFANVEVPACGDWGLTGLALDPDFGSNHYVYVHYMEEVTSDPLVTRPVVKRFTEVANVGTDPTVIHTGPQTDPTKARHHAANEIHFGPDGYLYVSVGDLRKEDVLISQDLSALEGKILRLNKADGSAPPDNPFVGTPGADPRIYAYGLRNGFGFTFHDETGGLFATENGPDRCDELNLIVAGGNYGWPIPYEESSCDVPVGIQPIFWFTFFLWGDEWEPNNTASPVGVDYIDGDTYPILGDSLLVCQWRNGKMRYIALGGPGQDEVVDDGLVTFDGEQITDCSLDVEIGPSGAIYYSNATAIKRILVDSDGDTVIDGSDNCANLANPGQENADGDQWGDACDPGDFDGDFFSDQAEFFCGSPLGDGTKVPERLGNGVDDDGDTSIDETQAAVAGFDCDGDGFDDDVEATLQWPSDDGDGATTGDEAGTDCEDVNDNDADTVVNDGCSTGAFGHNGTGHQERCAETTTKNDEVNDQWSADFDDNGRLNIADVTRFAFPVRHIGENVDDPVTDAHARWNLGGGGTININDVSKLGSAILKPPMFGGAPAFNAGTCPAD